MKLARLACAMLLALGGSLAHASVTGTETLTFDDIYSASGDTSENQISVLAPNYGGLSWDNVYVLHKDYNAGTGYTTGAVSGEWDAYNGYSYPASFSSDTLFVFNSAYVTRAWDNGTVHFDGYRNGQLVYSMDVAATTTIPKLASFNWTVDKVTFSSDSNSVLDNVTVSAVPEPESYAMLMAGLGLLGAVARRRVKA